MITDFSIFFGQTVPKNYFWDLGAPFQTPNTTTSATIYIQNSVPCISGYAPGLRVLFGNNSFSDEGFDLNDYTWDFGDYYHSNNNVISLSCSTGAVEHTYIMPGEYTVSLRHVQSKSATVFSQESDPTFCRGKYNTRWFWNELKCLTPLGNDNLEKLTWNETMCVPPTSVIVPRPKWWDNETKCFEKYCTFWSWYDLKSEQETCKTWTQTETDEEFEKKWMFEANDTVCTVSNAEFLNTVQTTEQNVFKTVVTVKEIMPVAGMHSVSATIGLTPLTLQLTPRNCKSGSFPLDRIDWDFGDGSPVKTTSRYIPVEDPDVVYTGYFGSDKNDVRNYDVIHTYNRTINSYPVFYPSLTCYSANTNSSDSCSITIGPIDFKQPEEELHILKTRNTLKGNIYAFSVDQNIALVTTNQFNNTLIPTPTIPFNPIRNTFNIVQNFYGYNGNEYPQLYIPSCELPPISLLTFKYLATEDDTPDIIDNAGLSALSGLPILTEGSSFITV